MRSKFTSVSQTAISCLRDLMLHAEHVPQSDADSRKALELLTCENTIGGVFLESGIKELSELVGRKLVIRSVEFILESIGTTSTLSCEIAYDDLTTNRSGYAVSTAPRVLVQLLQAAKYGMLPLNIEPELIASVALPKRSILGLKLADAS